MLGTCQPAHTLGDRRLRGIAEGRERSGAIELPGQIAALSAEGKRLLDTMADVSGVARRLADQRLQGIGNELGRCEARLATVERELATIGKTELESSWVTRCLNDFTAIWDVLTPENRGRLLRAVVQRVEVDEPANRVKVLMVDLCAELPAPVEVRAEEGCRRGAARKPMGPLARHYGPLAV